MNQMKILILVSVIAILGMSQVDESLAHGQGKSKTKYCSSNPNLQMVPVANSKTFELVFSSSCPPECIDCPVCPNCPDCPGCPEECCGFKFQARKGYKVEVICNLLNPMNPLPAQCDIKDTDGIIYLPPFSYTSSGQTMDMVLCCDPCVPDITDYLECEAKQVPC